MPSLKEPVSSDQSPVKIVGLGISHVPEHRQLFGTMTVYDNLILGAYHRYRRTNKQALEQDIERIYDIFPILKERRSQLAGTLAVESSKCSPWGAD